MEEKAVYARALCSVIVGVVLISICNLGITSAAQANAGITVSPPLKEITFGPGLLNSTTDIGITNNTEHDFSATVKLVDFNALDEFGGISLGQAGIPISKYGLANWMSLPGGSNIKLTKGMSTDLKVFIQNRADLTPGGHYGAVVITASSAAGKSGNNVGFNQELVSLIFLKKLGGDQYGLQLKSMAIDNGSNLPTNATMQFRSTGNVYVAPQGYINVTDPKGKLVEKGIINQESSLVMQGSTRQFVTLLQPVGASSITGRYKVTAYYRYDNLHPFSSKTVYFNYGSWSPRSIFLSVITGVILLLLLLTIQRRRRRRAINTLKRRIN